MQLLAQDPRSIFERIIVSDEEINADASHSICVLRIGLGEPLKRKRKVSTHTAMAVMFGKGDF